MKGRLTPHLDLRGLTMGLLVHLWTRSRSQLLFLAFAGFFMGTTLVWLWLDRSPSQWDDSWYLTNSLVMFDALAEGGRHWLRPTLSNDRGNQTTAHHRSAHSVLSGAGPERTSHLWCEFGFHGRFLYRGLPDRSPLLGQASRIAGSLHHRDDAVVLWPFPVVHDRLRAGSVGLFGHLFPDRLKEF